MNQNLHCPTSTHHTRLSALLVLLALGALTGCPSEEREVLEIEDPDASDEQDSGDAGGEVVDVPLPSSDWCDRVVPGPSVGSATTSAAVDLARAHALVRFFGVHEGYVDADTALAGALEGWSDPSVVPDLSAYASGLPGVCALAASDAALEPTRVETRGAIAFVRPGVGAPELTDAHAVVVLDLRDLPNTPELEGALVETLSAVLTGALDRPERDARQHNGMIDEAFAPRNGGRNIYTMELARLTRDIVPGQASKARPIVVWTGAKMAPAAAEFAWTLRQSSRAWLVGEDVLAEVAESHWTSHGPGVGLAMRAWNLGVGLSRWGDTLAADARILSLEDSRWEETTWSDTPPEAAVEAATREPVHAFDPIAQRPAATLSLGTMRASAIVAYGAADMFFPFFDVVGRGIDGTLTEVLSTFEDADSVRRGVLDEALLRIANDLHDGHAWVSDRSFDQTSRLYGNGVFPVRLDVLDGRPVVTWTAVPGLEVGDALVALDDEPIMDVYARMGDLVSNATTEAGWASTSYQMLWQPQAFTLRVEGMDGQERDVLVEPVAWDQSFADELYTQPWTRPSGTLDDLGAPDVLYLNLDGPILTSDAQLYALLPQLADADRVIVDLRGYPALFLSILDLLGTLIGESYSGPLFATPIRSGPVDWVEDDTTDAPYPGPHDGIVYTGKTVLLVDVWTQSKPENFAMGLVTQGAVTVVGRPSSGSNGNITGLQLPGDFAMTFTGLGVRFPDGSTFHGVGIQPDVRSERSRQDVVDGVDRVLLDAIDVVRDDAR